MEVRKILVGEEPWAIFNVTDFLLIGLMSIMFMQMMNILGMSWHRYALWRATGSAVTAQPMQASAPASAPSQES